VAPQEPIPERFGPLPEPAFAGNINLSRIYAPEDVKAAIRVSAGDFTEATRGVMSQDVTRDLAKLAGVTEKKLTARRAGKAFNAEELFAARGLLVEQATKVRNAARLAETGDDLQKAQFAEEMTRLVAIQEQVSGVTAEAGRALSQFRMLAGASKEEVAALTRIGEATDAAEMARLVNALPDTPEAVAGFARDATRAKTSDMLYEAWINGLLSNPTTHAVNTISNALVNVFSLAEAGATAGVSKLTGSGVTFREVGSRAFGTLEGLRDGLRATGHAFRTEEELFGGTGKLEARRRLRALPGTLGAVIRTPGRLLTAEDAFFKTLAYRQEINALSMRQALSEGHRGRALAQRIAELRSSPSAEMQGAATAFARKQTFTSGLGPFASRVAALRQAGVSGRVASVIVPFLRTPVNLIRFAAERTPIAPVMKSVRDDLAGKNGAVARDTAIARIGMGSAIGAWAVYETLQGNITGNGPTDPEKRRLWLADGNQPYSARVGDTWYSYSRLEPLGMLLGVAADMAELGPMATPKEREDLASLVTSSAARNLSSKTWLRGPIDLANVFSDPDRYGADYIMRQAGTIIPFSAAMGQTARTLDPSLREAETILDGIRERIPGQREQLFLKRDVFGEPITLGEGSFINRLANPIYQRQARNDPTIAEMLRLEVHPGYLRRKIGPAELTPEEWDFYSQAAGQFTKRALDGVVSIPDYQNWPDDIRSEAMAKEMKKAREAARNTTIAKFPDLALRIKQAKEGEGR
jgi:hypothetical protein